MHKNEMAKTSSQQPENEQTDNKPLCISSTYVEW